MKVLLLTLFFLIPSAFAADLETPLVETLRFQTLQMKQIAPRVANESLLVVLSIGRQAKAQSEVRLDFLAAVIRDKLSRLSIPNHFASPTLVTALRKIPSPSQFSALDQEASSPKLILELEITQEQMNTFTVHSRLSFICYQAKDKLNPLELRLQILLDENNVWEGMTPGEIPSRLAIYLRAEFNRLPKLWKRAQGGTYAVGSSNPRWSDETPPVPTPPIQYPTGRLEAGISAGTPAGLNAYLGAWFPTAAPLFLGARGGYFGLGLRGVQIESGVGIFRTGDWQHVVGVNAAWLNFTQVQSQALPDSNDQVTVDQLQPYLGPSYSVVWHHWSAEIGVAFPLTQTGNSPVRPMFGLGYSFSLLPL